MDPVALHLTSADEVKRFVQFVQQWRPRFSADEIGDALAIAQRDTGSGSCDVLMREVLRILDQA